MEEKTIIQIIEEVCEDICNNYCKYTEDRYAQSDDGTCGHFENCPLNRLQ